MNSFLLGIEWQATEIKIASVINEGKKFRLISLDHLSIPQSEPDKIKAIFSSWITAKFPIGSDIQAVITIPESQIFLKEISVPKIKAKKLNDVIFWEATSFAPMLPEEAVIQWGKISGDEKTQKIAVMVTRNSFLEEVYSILEKSGIRIIAIEPTSVSFGRLTHVQLNINTLLVSVEENETNSVVLRAGLPVFSSSASASLTAMKEQRWKLEKNTTEELAESVKKIISYWEERENQKIMQVVLVGEGVKYTGLATAINQFAQIPTIWNKPNELSNIDTAGQSKLAFSRFLIPFAAVLRLFEKEPSIGINFQPKALSEKINLDNHQKNIARVINSFTVINSLALLAFFVIFLFLNIWGLSLSKEINQTKLFVQNHPAQQFIPEINSTNNLIDRVDKLVLSQKDTGARLRLISLLTPENIVFTNLQLNNDKNEKWVIKGTGDRSVILAFYEKLRADSQAKEISMPFSNFEKDKDNNFEINITW